MNKQKTLIFFGAHPDDESFGIGATLAQYAISGVEVYYVYSTGGEEGTVDPQYMKGYATIEQLLVLANIGLRIQRLLGNEESPGTLVRSPPFLNAPPRVRKNIPIMSPSPMDTESAK